MKKHRPSAPRPRLLVALLAAMLLWSAAARAAEHTDPWFAAANGSAQTLPRGRWCVGIFQPLRTAVSEHIELSLHPLLFPLLPNVSLKWAHGHQGNWRFASRHSLYDPTPLLRLLRREGTGGILSPEFAIPNMAASSSEVLASHPIAGGQRVTLKVGLSVCLFRSSPLDRRATIDLPLVFPRLQPFFHNLTWRGGLEGMGRLWRRWFWLLDGDCFYTPRGEENWALEHKGMLLWDRSTTLQLGIGYKLSFCEYPYGRQWHLLGPLVDLQWAWGGH